MRTVLNFDDYCALIGYVHALNMAIAVIYLGHVLTTKGNSPVISSLYALV